MREIAIHLPMPPSTNAIWRMGAGKRVYRNPQYIAWQKRADSLLLYMRQAREKIGGLFQADIVLDAAERRRVGDLDNRIKAVLDYLQSREIIRNDRDLERLLVTWGHAPHGCFVLLRDVGPAVPRSLWPAEAFA